MTKTELKKCRHSKEKKLLAFGITITMLAFIMVFIGSFSRQTVIDFAEKKFIKEYKADFPLDKDLPDETILKKISKDDKDTLELFKIYYWYVVLFIPLLAFLAVLFILGKIYGSLKANAVQINENQYPEVYKLFTEMAEQLEIKNVPELYLINGQGQTNAFASCVPQYRNFAAIYSDIFERCLKNNDINTLRFILGHELGHIKFNHVKWWYIILTFWMNLPVIKYFFGLPLSRAKELGCDKIGAHLSNDYSGKALMLLAVGKYNYQDINIEKYIATQFNRPCFWSWFANLSNNHSVLSWRVAAVRKNHQAGIFFKNKKDNTYNYEN